jgi:hypothetical protein
MENLATPSPKTLSLTSNSVKDFWLLGGLSILVWLLFIAFDPMKANSQLVTDRFLQISVVFTWLSFICNYPHFLVSYKFAYSRGSKFIFQNWPSLIGVPVFFMAIYFVSYFFFNQNIAGNMAIKFFNSLILKTGLVYQIGENLNLGPEILAFSVRVMYITVGWHYAKQVFGCMMVYGNYSQYHFTKNQKFLLKLSLFSIAFYNFFYISIPLNDAPSISYFFNVPIMALGFSGLFVTFFQYTVIFFSLSALYFIFYKNYQMTKKLPPLNVLVPYVAFHVWWFPLIRQSEYYFIAIPFFHSLQYLPFAYRLEVKRGIKTTKDNMVISMKIIILIIVGILAFETVPHFLDMELDSYGSFNTWFFMISFAVFINVHHFFIDSVIWKFKHPDVRDRILN